MCNTQKKRSLVLFLIVSLVFGVLTTFITLGGDDLVYIHRPDLSTIYSKWVYVYDAYFTWSSRVLINFVWMVLIDMGKYAWGLYFAISLFVFFYSASVLFNPNDNPLVNEFIIVTVMTFPFILICSAGWIATTTCYFGPLAAGMFSLIPIFRIYREGKVRKKEFVLSAIMLIYASSDEQMMMVLLLCYLVAFIYFVVVKKPILSVLFQLFLCFANCAIVFLSPGNSVRKMAEIRDHFPDYLMMGLDDKLELGLSTTLKWLIMDGHIFFIEFTLIIAILIVVKYKEPLYRVWGTVPVIFTVLYSVMDNSALKLFGSMKSLKEAVPFHGDINATNGGKGLAVLQLTVMLIIVTILYFDIILICDTIEELLICSVLLIGGTGSRVIMGFSPTIYVSGFRTCSIMIVCFIFVTVFLGSKLLPMVKEDAVVERSLKWLFPVTTILLMLNYASLVFGYFV